MLIKSSSTLRNEYDKIVKIAKEKKEAVFITRNGEGEMVIMTIEEYERREAEQKLARILLDRERSRISGAKTYSTEQVVDNLGLTTVLS